MQQKLLTQPVPVSAQSNQKVDILYAEKVETIRMWISMKSKQSTNFTDMREPLRLFLFSLKSVIKTTTIKPACEKTFLRKFPTPNKTT